MSNIYTNDDGIHSPLCNESKIHDDKDAHHVPYKLILVFFILLIGCLFKTIFAFLRVPYTGIILLIAFLGGILLNILTTDETFHPLITTSPDLLVAIFLPILIFESAYRTEYHAFMKSLYFILLLSIVGYSISLFAISLLNKYLFFFRHWTFLQCFILGIILSVTRPVTLMRPSDYGKTKRLNVILEGETVINTCLAILLFNAMKPYVVNNETWPTSEFFKTTTISIIGGIGLGTLTGILEIIGLPYFYDDPISEVTITLTVPYILYWLCEQLSCSGVLAIAILGLILSHHKTAISSEVASFLDKFWDMLILLTNTIIYIFSALALAEFIKPNIRIVFQDTTILYEIGLSVLNYFICYTIRFLVIITLTFCTKFFRIYRLSWKESILLTCGGFKGSICLILILDFASELQLTQYHSSKFKYQILIDTILVVFLSSCINSTYSFLLKLLNLTNMSQTKYLYTIQCIESLRILIDEKIRLLKKNKYLADADWIFIEKNFLIEYPHTANLSNREMPAIPENSQCQNCHRFLLSEFNPTHYEDLIEESRVHIINIQKTRFWRQYRDYEISTETVRVLSSLCDFAIDTKGQYITVDQLKDYYKPRTFDFIWKYLGSFAQQIHRCTRDDWREYRKVPRHSWRLFYYNILNHRRFNLLMSIVILLNVTLAILRCIWSFSSKINLILTVIQNLCVLVYFVEFLIKTYTYTISLYFRTWIHYRLEFILLLLAIIECIFEYCYLSIESTSIPQRIFILMQSLIILQIFRLSRLFEHIAMSLMHVFDRLANRYITLSLELCKACISSEDDVLSKLNYIIEIDQIREQFQRDANQRREELIQELTCIQRDHPNVSASVKTRAVIQKLLNYFKNMIHHMTEKGLLGENEAHQITEDINKRLHTELVPSVVFFPIPFHFFYIFPWLHDTDVFEYVLSCLHVKSFSLNEYIYEINSNVQALFFLTCGYVEIIQTSRHYHDALSIEKYSKIDEKSSTDVLETDHDQLCYQCRMNRTNLLHENLFEHSDDELERNHFQDANEKSSLSNKKSSKVYRLLRAPGDILGQIDLLNGGKYTETCKCLTNTLVWYLESKDLNTLFKRFDHLRIFDKIWHYSALQIAETVLYEYFNTLPSNITKQERLHIYGYLKYSFLIPESYLIKHQIIYSSHELILIQGQLQNILSSLIYTGPCFIQKEIGQCGLKPANRAETRILVLRSTHHIHHDEFVRSNDLPDLWTHVIYDHRLAIFLPRMGEKYEEMFTSNDGDDLSPTTETQSELFFEK